MVVRIIHPNCNQHLTSVHGGWFLRSPPRDRSVKLFLRDEFFDRTGDVFDGYVRGDAVLVEEIDAIRPEPF